MACINKHRCSSCPHPCKSEIQEKEFSKWWASLTVAQKIQVMGEDYPQCTVLWLTLKRDERIAKIEQSGIIRKKGNKYTALGHDF